MIETLPSPARVVAAIAGYPYTPRTAILDLVDNSIEADATSIGVMVKYTGTRSNAIVIADNGTGVASSILDEVLRAGSETDKFYSSESLSRYGMGAKGAGLSLGGKLTILTRSHDEPLRRRTIDVDIIRATNKWLQDAADPSEDDEKYFAWCMEQIGCDGVRSTGTVVIIERLNIRSRDVNRVVNDLTRHVGETYFKFMTAGGAQPLRIVIDGKQVRPVDPLHRENSQTRVLFNREPVNLDDTTTLYFSAVVLPHPKQLADPELEKQYRYKQADQGIYVFRNNRMIASGQTLDFFSKDFHLNSFRAELAYSTAADEHVLVDVAKSSVTLSPEATSRLQELVSVCTKTANMFWRDHDVLTEDDILGLFDESNRLIASRANLLIQRQVHPRKGRVSKRSTAANPGYGPVPPRLRQQPYLIPVQSLPNGILYRPAFDEKSGNVAVEVNLNHPFSRVVFSIPKGGPKAQVPRKPTTAVQQLLYVLGTTELSFDEDNLPIFEQYRHLASLNLSTLLND